MHSEETEEVLKGTCSSKVLRLVGPARLYIPAMLRLRSLCRGCMGRLGFRFLAALTSDSSFSFSYLLCDLADASPPL